MQNYIKTFINYVIMYILISSEWGMFMPIILREIKKSFGKKNVLNGVSMELGAGNITGILGNNGSGKTTLMKIISGIYNYDSGIIENLVYDSGILDVCNMMENSSFNGSMTVLQNLKYFINLSIEKSDDFKYYVNLFKIDYLNEKFGKLSLGMKQKVAMLYIFLKKSKILLLDEITNGLDERIIELFYKELKCYVKKNQIYTLISSHKIYELQGICDCIYILDDGNMQKEININQNGEGFDERKIFVFKNEIFANEFLKNIDEDLKPILQGNSVSIIWHTDSDLQKVIILASRYNLINLLDDKTTLEKYYFDLTRKE